MQCHMIYSLCVVLMFRCIAAHGEDGIEQNNNEVVGRAGNLDLLLMVNLFSTLQSEIKDLRTEMKELEEINTKHKEEISELQTQVKDVDIAKLKEDIEFKDVDIAKLKEEIEQLKKESKDKPKTVYSQVQLLGYNTFAAGARVKFTGTIANIGAAYKTAQGYFVAPYDGTYLFTASLCVKFGNYAEFRIVQDNNILSEGFTGNHAWHDCSSATAATYMRKGSKVWVELDRVQGGVISSNEGIPSFTGVFLNSFKKP